MSIFKGSGVAIITPFNEDLTVNYDVFKDLINFQIENGTDALIVCGTTGEASVLTDDEQIECIKFAVDTANKRVPVIAGCGSNDTSHGAELFKRSYQAGADAALIVTPYYNKTTQKGLIEHYQYIAAKASLPIIIYGVPSRTGLNIVPKTAYELSKIENIVAIKEASANVAQVAEIAALCGDRMDIYSGCDELNLPILSIGAQGIISVLANIMPAAMHEGCQKFFEGDIESARKIYLKTLSLVSALFIETSPIPVKAALSLMGYNVGRCKMPLTTIDDKNLKILKEAMADNNLL